MTARNVLLAITVIMFWALVLSVALAEPLSTRSCPPTVFTDLEIVAEQHYTTGGRRIQYRVKDAAAICTDGDITGEPLAPMTIALVCFADLDGDGKVADPDDIALFRAAFGADCTAIDGGCPADFNRDGAVDRKDLAILRLSAWGCR